MSSPIDSGTNKKSLRAEVNEQAAQAAHNESPLDPTVYLDHDQDSTDTISTLSATSSNHTAAVYPFVLPLKGEKVSVSAANNCSLLNIRSIIFKALFESAFFGALLVIPSLMVYFMTEDSWYNFLIKPWNTPHAHFSSVIEFVRVSVHVAMIYAAWVIVDAATRVIPLTVRRSWHPLKTPLPNAIKTSLAGWKAARSSIKVACFGLVALILTDILVFGSSKLIHSATKLSQSTNTLIESFWELIEKALMAFAALSTLILGQKIIMQKVTKSYRKQALASRIIRSNFKFGILTRLFRQSNLGSIDARRSIALSTAREALHLSEDGVVELSKDTAGINLSSQSRAESLASSLWTRVCPYGRDYLVLEDFNLYFTPEDSPDAFAVFDVNGTGIVNSVAWAEAISSIWTERCNLKSSVRMSDQTLKALENLINSVILFFWTLSVLGCVSPHGQNFVLSSAGFVVAFGFIFKSTCERIFKSFIFVLVEHPFDIGDTVIVEDTRYIVLGIELFTSTLKRVQDGTVTYIPNNLLSESYIYNEQRSDLTIESMLVTIPSKTSVSILGSLQANLTAFLSKSFPNFTGSLNIHPIETQDSKMNVRVECKFQDIYKVEKDLKIARKNALSEQIQLSLKNQGINI